MLGGWPGASAAIGGVQWVSTGACGGLISTAEGSAPAAVRRWPGRSRGRSPVRGRCGRGDRGVGRPGDRDLHRRWCGRRRPGRCRVVRGRPRRRVVRWIRASPRRTRVPSRRRACLARTRAEVPVRSVAGERDHRERGVLADLADRLAAADAGQRLLGQQGVGGAGLRRPRRGTPSIAHGNMTTVAARAVNRVGRQGGGTARADVTYVSDVACVSTRTSADQVTANLADLQRHRRVSGLNGAEGNEPTLRCRFGQQVSCGQAAGAAAAAVRRRPVRPTGSRSMIDGITMPLSRSIAWPTPSCLRGAAQVAEQPAAAGARRARPSEGSPRIG